MFYNTFDVGFESAATKSGTRGGTMKSKGFTLIELAVVLAIIAVLAAILTPIVTGYLDQARVARAQADTRTVADAISSINETPVDGRSITARATSAQTRSSAARR